MKSLSLFNNILTQAEKLEIKFDSLKLKTPKSPKGDFVFV